MTFATEVENRYFEDYLPGAFHEFGSIAIEESEMIAFALRFDPQPFHTNPETAKRSVFGGLISIGWHITSLTIRLLVSPTFTQRERRTSK